ncbi:MAG: C25 family cysteine peptidase, partial [candidate division Zixibacteria bacterium]
GSTIVNLDQAGRFAMEQSSFSGKRVSPSDLSLSDDWFKINVTSTGLHRVSGAQLQSAGLSLINLESSSIRLFNSGGRILSLMNSDPRPQFEEIAIIVEDGGDGVFEAIDRIYFFGESVDRWVYEIGEPVSHVNNIYTATNVYWLTVGDGFAGPANRMDVQSQYSGTTDTTITTFLRRVHVEQDNLQLRDDKGHVEDYYSGWMWDDSAAISLWVSSSGYVPGDVATVAVWARTGWPDYVDLWVQSRRAVEVSANNFECRFTTTDLTGGLDQFRFDLETNSASYNTPFFDYMQLSYNSLLEPSNGQLDIALGSYDGPATLQVIDDFLAEPIVLDLTDPSQPSRVTGIIRSSGYVNLELLLEAGSMNRLVLCTPNSAALPSSIERVEVNDIRSAMPQTDLVIVAPRVFHAALADYKAYRESQGHTLSVVAVEDIMDFFGFGQFDPVAIRDFLKHAFETWPQPSPSAVLFVGDASYDYMDAYGTGVRNYVPSLVHPWRGLDWTYSDDNYVYFGDYAYSDADSSYDSTATPVDYGFDMMVARWPVSSVAEINSIVEKIKSYETSSNLGSWRNRIALVADDEYSDRAWLEPQHTTQTETLSRDHIPDHFLRNKVYTWDFPFENDNRPTANDAITDAFNDGSLIVNYVGHGNPDIWSHERVFTRLGDLPRLHNSDRLPLVFAASCAISFFDDPMREAMGEDLLAMPGGGAISVLAATRLVYSSDNSAFNRKVYDVLLDNHALSICEALYLSKLERVLSLPGRPFSWTNDRAYALFGDPYLKLAMPRYRVLI